MVKTALKYAIPFAKELSSPVLDNTILGGKGQGLVEMASLGLPVPPGFIITTEACNDYRKHDRHLSKEIEDDIFACLATLEKVTNLTFGNDQKPLLVSVRSGARISMPGMMDTILNLGLNDKSVVGFAESFKNEHLAYDNYRRLIMMYGDIVCGVSRKHFESAFQVIGIEEGVEDPSDISVKGLKEACRIFKTIFEHHAGYPFPQNAKEQLINAIKAVFNSWDSERATLYRQINHIPDDWGTAVIVQKMVFGNKNNRSATGVCFTRDPATGENHFYGEFLTNAQGEEVVAGIRTPHPMNLYQKEITKSNLESLEELLPEAYKELDSNVHKLEKHYKDVQDIEFTIDDGRLYMLQTRSGKRTGFAALRIAVEMLDEGLIDEKTALKRIQPNQLTQILAPIFEAKAKNHAKDKLAGKGLNAGPGAASGKVAFTAQKAVELKQKGFRSILVRVEANPNDFPGMVASDGILTLKGGSTSHAAVVARGMGKPCVVGCGSLHINELAKTITGNNMTIKEEDPISIDGSTGEVFFCDLPTSPSEVVQVLITKTKKPSDSLVYQRFRRIMEISDKFRKLDIFANADTPQDCHAARSFGATGIGLCRTEHMFMQPNRLYDVRSMFFSIESEERKKAIERLLPHQKGDFKEIFRVMDGLPVTIRLLDPPMHEFMPHSMDELAILSSILNAPQEELVKIRNSLIENNPMLGNRGCRLGITYPELTEMQTRAILEAAIEVMHEGVKVQPEIMIPLVGILGEIVHQKHLIDKTAEKVFAEQHMKVHYLVGTMIELPRAALIADQIAKYAEFFSFGTNDLTQTTFGISRDDSSKFVPIYVKGVPDPIDPNETVHILTDDPFQTIDKQGVGKLMEMAVNLGKAARPDLKCGICGEHGGDPQSIAFCSWLGLDYVSCSPYRVPVARLAAALANIE